MKLNELKSCLQRRPELTLGLALPDGSLVPAHFHVTEVGHVAKRFVDCGGTFRATEACVLQAFVGSPKDDGHRLNAGRLMQILGFADALLPSGDLPVEVEYEDGAISQYPVMGAGLVGGTLTLRLGLKHTDCLAREKCGLAEGGGCSDEPAPASAEATGCCAGPAGGKACC